MFISKDLKINKNFMNIYKNTIYLETLFIIITHRNLPVETEEYLEQPHLGESLSFPRLRPDTSRTKVGSVFAWAAYLSCVETKEYKCDPASAAVLKFKQNKKLRGIC
jgi:hypothetical protein